MINMKLHLETNIAEGTPEELVEYLRLVEEGDKPKVPLFTYGNAHQPDEDALKSLIGSMKEADSYTDSTEIYTDEADIGEFYIVNVDNSALLKGTLLKKTGKHTHEDSLGDEYLHVDDNAVVHIDKHLYQLEDRFNFATQIGIRLTDTTDLAEATEGDYFKVLESYASVKVGDIVTITKDDRDNQPQCNDEYGNFCYVLLGHLELLHECTEPTEEAEEEEEDEKVEFQVGDKVRVLESAWGAEGVYTVTKVLEDGMVLIEGKNRNGRYLTNWSSHASNLEKIEEEPSTELQVGDRVKVLRSAYGAVGEATVTKVLEEGRVEIAGTNKDGVYLNNWGSNVLFLEKIEEEEDVEVDPEEAEGLLGYRYWYLEGTNFNKFVVLEAGANYFEDSTGKRYTYQSVSGYVKPIDREDAYVKFERARDKRALLSYYPVVDAFATNY